MKYTRRRDGTGVVELSRNDVWLLEGRVPGSTFVFVGRKRAIFRLTVKLTKTRRKP